MRAHVAALSGVEGAPLFLIVDHDDSWGGLGPVFYETASWWRNPAAVAVFRGVPSTDVAQLAIEVGGACYCDDEVDGAIDSGWKSNPLREIVKRGRHLRNKRGHITSVSAMVATHRPANLPGDILGCFGRVYVGRLQGVVDAERCYREGWVAAESVIDAREKLEARAPGEFSAWP